MSTELFPMSSGFVRFDRGWLTHPGSPFAGTSFIPHHRVWHHLASHAPFDAFKTFKKAEYKVTSRELALYCGVPQPSVVRIMSWLESKGLIEILSSHRRYHIRITHYDLLDDWEAYMDATGSTSHHDISREKQGVFDAVENRESNATGNNISISQDNSGVFKSARIKLDLAESTVNQTKQGTSICNHGEKAVSKRGAESTVNQKTGFIKRSTNKKTYINNYSVKSDDTVPPSIAYRRKAGGALVSDFDKEIAQTWANRMKAADKERAEASGKPIRERKPSIAKWADVICKMRTIDGLSEEDIRLILETRFSDEFYQATDMCPGNLRSKAVNGHPKWFNVLAKGKRATDDKNAATAPKTPSKSIVKILSIEELCK